MFIATDIFAKNFLIFPIRKLPDMNTNAAIDHQLIFQWVEEKLDLASVEERLRSMFSDNEIIRGYLKEFKKRCQAKRQMRGFVMTGIGAFLGFVAFMMAVFNPFPSLFHFFLYGVTGVALILIFAGLYFLFE